VHPPVRPSPERTTWGRPPDEFRRRAILAVATAVTAVVWLHLLSTLGASGSGQAAPLLSHARDIALDAMLVIPVLAAAVWLADRMLAERVLATGQRPTGRHAGLVALFWLPLAVPLLAAQVGLHQVLHPAGSGHAHGGAAAPGSLTGYLTAGLRDALAAQPVVFGAALAFATALAYRFPVRRFRRALRTAMVAGAAALLGLVLPTQATAVPGPVPNDVTPAATGSCASAPTRTYNVSAINIDITVNRWGDHDPFGYMYVLAGQETAVRAQEAALQAAAHDPNGHLTGARVSPGLGADPIQPLVLRANFGTCVVVNLTNKLTAPPRGGNGLANGGNQPVITQPGGIPAVSMEIQGVAFNTAEGGEAVGNNPANLLVSPGGTHTYRFFVDPAMGEGAKPFRSGGESSQLTAHGLFGALVAERSGSRWFDPRTGQEKTNDLSWNSWDAMVQTPNKPTFREFTIMYHEIGDENFNVRRPVREDPRPNGLPDPDGNGQPIAMVDDVGLSLDGADTDSYRPGSRALNYRSEPFWRRLLEQGDQGRTDQQLIENESLSYGSYQNGDPATPMPRSYLGEPTKTRLVHPGFEQLHVHHLHGGGDRWRQNPDADDTDIDGGLSKVPVQNAKSIRLDSQTVGPQESYNLEHECGAGGCQQVAGDFLYHCHIAHHYIAGMWSFWRVFDTQQSGLATLPGRAAAPTAVTSAGLLGRTVEGKTVVLQANLTDPNTQVALEALVEGQLPPQGVRLNDTDSTVWDWQKGGTATAPVYLGEPETTSVWPDYTSPTPGQRPQIMFNPNNGRYAWPLFRPHLAIRPPFSANGHTGTPWLGNTTTPTRPDGLCPASAPVRTYNITAISVPLQQTIRERDPDGEVFVLNENKDAVIAAANNGTRSPEPLAIRSNVGDCVAITLTSELNPTVQPKVNMHTHFVQFDPQASDGVITGFSYEQSVYNSARDNHNSTAATAAGASTIPLTNATGLRVGVSVAVGAGRPDIEIRKITAINGSTLTVTPAFSQAHASGERVTVEFTQYRWFSDVDSGTVFWHDHVNGIKSWAHGLFGAHIIEPRGSSYHDPVTGAQVRSGAIVDIHTNNSAGVGTGGSFREYMIWLSNGRRGRPELANPNFFGLLGMNRNFGQECEEGSINLRAAPVGERVPGGATPADPNTTAQRQEFDGMVCRHTTSNVNDGTGNNTVNALVSTVDPYMFSSVKYGDPRTPLLRAYVGDPVVIRTIGLNEKAEGLRIQGHRFRPERFNANGQLVDTATTGISERFDYILDGGAGGPARMPGDYLYYSARNFAFESGAWGVFRVHDRRQNNLQVLPGRTAPPTGAGFPVLTAATGNTQQTPGPNPPPASQSGVVTNSASACPSTAPRRNYDVSLLNATLPSAPQTDANGVIYALTSDVAAIRAGTKKVEPLVIRANSGDCVQVTLRNQATAGSRYGGTRAGLDLSLLQTNPQNSGGAAIGLNPDTTVAIGGSATYQYFANQQLGTAIFRNFGSEAAQRHGAYGLLIVEPQGSNYFDSRTGAALTATSTSAQAIIRAPNNLKFREFGLTLSSTDQHLSRSIVPYQDVVAGAGVNSSFAAGNPAVGNAPAWTTVSYSSEPLTVRLGLTTSPPNPSPNFATAFSSAVHGDPHTPLFRSYAGDPVVFRVGVGSSDQLHVFNVGGHVFLKEPLLATQSSLLPARAVTAGETLDAIMVGSSTPPQGQSGDYRYGDTRQQLAAAGMWGIFRVAPSGPTLSDLARL
jgi:hypothetical protein